MTQRTCEYDGCDRKHDARGLCKSHYNQWARGKDLTPIVARVGSPGIPRRVAGYDASGGPAACWPWTGTVDALGYGVLHRKGRLHKAHRFVWNQLVGPIPNGLVLDHRCFLRKCVNPDHLRAVTQKQNAEHQQGLNRNNTSGYRNVTRAGNRWNASIRHNRKLINLGNYETPEEADAAARAGRARYFTCAD